MFVPRSQRCGRAAADARGGRPDADPAPLPRRRSDAGALFPSRGPSRRSTAKETGRGDPVDAPCRRAATGLARARRGPRRARPAKPSGAHRLGGEGPRARNGPRGRPGAAPVPRSPPASGRRAPDIRVFSPPNGCWPSCDRRGDRPMVEMRPPSHRPIRVAGSLGRAARPKEGAGERPAGPDDGAGPEGSAARCRQATRHDPSRVRRRGPPPARPPDRCVLR